MEIIEISEKTVSTKKAPKPEVKPNGKQNYSPPEVLSRPKSPGSQKRRKIAEPKKVKEKKSKDLSKAESILKSIEKIKSKKNNTSKEIEEKTEKENVKVSNIGEKLTISEKDAIRRQFYSCWIVPAGAKNIKDYKVSIKLKLNTNGEVISSQLTNSLLNADPFFRTLAESAVRAVNHPNCKKLKVPKENMILGEK